MTYTHHFKQTDNKGHTWLPAGAKYSVWPNFKIIQWIVEEILRNIGNHSTKCYFSKLYQLFVWYFVLALKILDCWYKDCSFNHTYMEMTSLYVVKLQQQSASSTISITHFPTELKQCIKFHQRSDICFLKAKRVYMKASLTVKWNNSGFWSYFTSKLRNFETRFQARDTWPRVIWGYLWIALE